MLVSGGFLCYNIICMNIYKINAEMCAMKRLFAMLSICLFMLSGCGGDLPSDMYALPEMPETHSALIETVEFVRGGGYEFSEPRSGLNRQPIQLMDLDGDGEEEGVAFLRDVADTYKTFIYVFEKNRYGFELFDIIEGSENEIYTVSYSDILGRNGYEIIVEWGKAADESRTVTVYNRAAENMEKLFEISAVQYSVSDIDGNGQNEFLAVVKKGKKTNAEIYSFGGGEPEKCAELPLRRDAGKLVRIKAGNVGAQMPGIFIERELDSGILTEVISSVNGKFCSLISEGSTCRAYALCSDINSDGVTELPQTASTDASGTGGTYLWYRAGAEGKLSLSAFTYHDFNSNWYVMMPASWSSTVMAERKVTSSNETSVSFFSREVLGGDSEQYIEVPLFRILILSGSNRESAAVREGRFIISERDDIIFAAEISSGSYLSTEINEEFIKNIFKTRESEWASDILFA